MVNKSGYNPAVKSTEKIQCKSTTPARIGSSGPFNYQHYTSLGMAGAIDRTNENASVARPRLMPTEISAKETALGHQGIVHVCT